MQIRKDVDGATMSFFDHLDDLRTTFIKCAWALAIAMCITLALVPYIIDALILPVARVVENNGELVERVTGLEVTTMAPEDAARKLIIADESLQAIKIWLAVAFWSGLILATPAMLYYIGLFVFPGLHDEEKLAIKRGSWASSVLFFLGVGLGYWFSLPFFVRVNMAIADWIGISVPWFKGSEYIMTVIKVLLAFGLSFQLPVLVFILGFLGIFDSNDLRAYRRHVAVGILILAMFLTPPDIGTQLVLAVPLFILFEITINLIWLKERKELKESGEPVGGFKDVLQSLGIIMVPVLLIAGYGFFKSMGPDNDRRPNYQKFRTNVAQHLVLVCSDAQTILGAVETPEDASKARLSSYGINSVFRDLIRDFRQQSDEQKDGIRQIVAEPARQLDKTITALIARDEINAQLEPTLMNIKSRLLALEIQPDPVDETDATSPDSTTPDVPKEPSPDLPPESADLESPAETDSPATHTPTASPPAEPAPATTNLSEMVNEDRISESNLPPDQVEIDTP